MKKIVIVLFLFFILIANVSAEKIKFDAEKTLDGIYYEKFDGKNTYYRMASKIIDTSSKQLAYCVQPFVDLTGSDNYVAYPEYNQIFKFTEKEWERIRLFSYYGYGYKNHLEEKWISITQLSLWRDVYPNFRFDWINNLSSKIVITPYNKEIQELNRLVNTHRLKPSIKEEYVIGINSELILEDNNMVLENFDVVSSDFRYKKGGNKITIYSDEEIDGKISFNKAKNIYSNPSIFYYDKDSQAVVKRGNVEEINFDINISVKQGKVIVNKSDDDTKENNPQGDASLDGAVYELLNSNKEKIDELVIKDNYLTFDNLEFGTYHIREIKAGTGYYVDDNLYEVIIDEENLAPEIKLTNKVIKSRVNLHKYYGTKEELDNNKIKPEKNIIFEIYDSNNVIFTKLVTDEKGFATVELPFGVYSIRQVNTTSGYKKIEDYLLVIDENNNKSQDIFLYDLKIEVPNAGVN